KLQIHFVRLGNGFSNWMDGACDVYRVRLLLDLPASTQYRPALSIDYSQHSWILTRHVIYTGISVRNRQRTRLLRSTAISRWTFRSAKSIHRRGLFGPVLYSFLISKAHRSPSYGFSVDDNNRLRLTSVSCWDRVSRHEKNEEHCGSDIKRQISVAGNVRDNSGDAAMRRY
ncbi:hypothetical protein PFISCL1PPCAC_13486, partial [Pristionchus fissidentatus]